MNKPILIEVMPFRLESGESAWYEAGGKYLVVDYKHNPALYWQLASWDGNGSSDRQWFLKRHCRIILNYDIKDNLFEI